MENGARSPLLLADLTSKVIRAFYDVYNELAGFPEFVLRRALAIVLAELGLAVVEEASVDVWFRGHKLCKFRIDLIVESVLVVEIKVRDEIEPYMKAQVLHYLKATGFEVGLLLNFGRKPQFARVVYHSAGSRPPVEVPTELAEESWPARNDITILKRSRASDPVRVDPRNSRLVRAPR
jgi:GxxExxY protein